MRRNEQRLALIYAKAVYNLLKDQLSEEQYEQLLGLAHELDTQRIAMLLVQVVQAETTVLETFFSNAGFGDLFVPLVKLLTAQRRIVLFPLILRAVYRRHLADKGIMHFIIESPVELTKKEQEGFVSFLQKKTGKEIRYTLKSNPDLLAGVKMYSDTLGYEHSIQQKLYQL